MTGPILISSFDGAQIAAWTQGSAHAPTILLSHYLGGDARSWRDHAERLAERFRVVMYDSRGHGASAAPKTDYSAEMLGRDALALIDHFGVARSHFLGVSQGGMAGMWLAANAPERIDRLVLANTTPFIPNKAIWNELVAKARAEGLHDIAASTILSWLSEGFKASHPQRAHALVETMRGMSVDGYAGACAVLRDVDLRADLARIAAPTLVIGGAEDGPRGAAAPLIAASVQNGRLMTIPHAAHLSHIENPQAFAAALAEHFI